MGDSFTETAEKVKFMDMYAGKWVKEVVELLEVF